MKTRRHHNNDGRRQIQRGSTRKQVERIARKLGIPCEGTTLAQYYQSCGTPKPEPRKRVKGRKQRAERAVKQSVRAQCVERDGFCAAIRLSHFVPGRGVSICVGWSEWAHLKGHRRSQTRGMKPEARHTTKHSLMLCTRHHAMEEAGKLKVVYLTARGCDGPLRFEVKA